VRHGLLDGFATETALRSGHRQTSIQSSHATTIKGRSKRYSRYWCFTKGCRGVSVGAEGLETHLHTLLDRIQPAANLLAKLPTIAARSWGSRKERIGADSKALVRRLDDQQALNRQTIEARVRETLSDADFQTLKSSIEAESPHSGADKGSRFRGLHNGSTG